jgi:small subunit ribosomal protein S2
VIPGNDDALRAIRLFTSKIADSVIEGRALATEHDFTGDKVSEAKEDEAPVEDITEYSQYVDPKYAEQIMQESLMIGEDTQPAGRKGLASETSASDAAAAEAQNV